jgi:hypothetical protein
LGSLNNYRETRRNYSSKINEATFSFTLSFKKTSTEIKTETMDLELDKENRVIKVLVVEDIKLNHY